MAEVILVMVVVVEPMRGKLGIIAVVGVVAIVLGILTGGGSCAPVGDYSGDGGLDYNWERGGFEYGNGCIWYIREILIAFGVALIGTTVFVRRLAGN